MRLLRQEEHLSRNDNGEGIAPIGNSKVMVEQILL